MGEEELAAYSADARGLADWRTKECRVCISQMAAIIARFERPNGQSRLAWAFHLKCSFQSGRGASAFRRASLRVELPEGEKFLHVLPVKVEANQGVDIKVEHGGSITVGIQQQPVNVSAEYHHTRSASYVYHSCMLTGSGAGTPLAWYQWAEDKHRKAGVDTDSALWLVLPYISGKQSFDVHMNLDVTAKFGRAKSFSLVAKRQLLTID